jgi:enamine deaminase RidA (YjgF/YER057c/UK114 family)
MAEIKIYNVDALGKPVGPYSQFTTYLVHSQDIARFYRWREQNYPKMFPDGNYPPNTLLIIDRLVQEQFLIEIQTIAAV